MGCARAGQGSQRVADPAGSIRAIGDDVVNVGSLFEIGWRDVGDILLVALMLFGVILWLRRTRARRALLGLIAVVPVYLVAAGLEFQVTLRMVQGFLAVLVIVLVVVFQDDLRRFFERIGTWGLGERPALPSFDAVDALARTAGRLAETRSGALIVIPGGDPLDRHLEGGVGLQAQLSEPLLLSLFDTGSPGHDGAIVVSGDRVESFAVHLPLSTDHVAVGAGGTRHAAALGLAERCDALCIVVSEERGTISVARDGRLRVLQGAQELAGELRGFIARSTRGSEAPSLRWKTVTRSWREAGLALGLGLALWFVFVPGSQSAVIVRSALVAVENLPMDYELVGIEPAEVQVSLSGPRRLFLGGGRLRVRLDAWYVQLGRRTFQVTPAEVEHPPGFAVRGIAPETVRLTVRQIEKSQK
jgi:uncharacterized protein (TIGR00159 family)